MLTALHVVFNSARGGWATSVTITPGADTQPYNAPYGSFTGSRLNGRTANWDTNGDQLLSYAEAQYELAVIGLNQRLLWCHGGLPLDGHMTSQLPLVLDSMDGVSRPY